MYNDSTFFVSNNKNIFTWNFKSNAFKNITPGEDKRAGFISNAIVDKDGLIWIASFGTGLYCYNPVTKSTKNYRKNPKDSSSIGSSYISFLKEDNDGNLWIGTLGNGLQ